MNKIAIPLALLVGLTGFYLLSAHKNRFELEATGGALVPIVVASEDIPLGSALSESSIAIREMPSKYLEERHVLGSDARRIIGVRASMGIRANESILWTDLATASADRRDLSGLVPPGMRAVTVRASKGSSFGGLLRAGDRVDVLLTTDRNAQEVTIPLLQNLLVLAIGQDMGASAAPGMDDLGRATIGILPDITLSVSINQAQALTLAGNTGSLTVVLRNPDDITVVSDLPETTAADIQLAERIARLQGRRPAASSSDTTAKKEIENVSSDR